MIDDGVKGEGVDEEQVKVGDIAMHVLEAIERGEARPTNDWGSVLVLRRSRTDKGEQAPRVGAPR